MQFESGLKLLTVPEAAKVLGLTEQRLYNLMRQGIIKPVALGRQRRISAASLQAFIDSGGQALPGGWRRAKVASDGR